MQIKFDIAGLGEKLRGKLQTMQNPEYLLRPVAFDLVALMTERIHDKGLDSNEQPIGTYSDGYMSLRENKYNRTADKKVVISLTRQLENDWSVIAIPKGYGIGFKNQHNRDKAGWVTETYKRPIFELSKTEEEYARNRFKELINESLSS